MNLNLLGIDFEEWYHLELVQKNFKREKEMKPTVIQGIDKILDWLRKNETLATFFVVGELLEFKPEIFDKIIENGHEIGFHTMHHTKLDKLDSKEKFNDEIKKFGELTSDKSRGFRAPTFSLNQKTSWAIDALQENNYLYDSSVVPAKTSMYGLPDAEHKPYRITSRAGSRILIVFQVARPASFTGVRGRDVISRDRNDTRSLSPISTSLALITNTTFSGIRPPASSNRNCESGTSTNWLVTVDAPIFDVA